MVPDEDLIRQASSGSADAWRVLVERYGQFVYANARAVGADRELSLDVSQLVWLKLISRLDSLRDPAAVRGWLAIVARNTARSELRRRRDTVPVDAVAHSLRSARPEPADVAEMAWTSRVVRESLSRISDSCRELLTLLFGAEMSYAEISDLTGRPVGSIGPTRQRCLDAMRREIGDRGV